MNFIRQLAELIVFTKNHIRGYQFVKKIAEGPRITTTGDGVETKKPGGKPGRDKIVYRGMINVTGTCAG